MSDIWWYRDGYRFPCGHGRSTGNPAHKDRVRHSEIINAEPGSGGHKVSHAWPDQWRYAGLHGEFPESPYESSQEEAPGRRTQRVYRIGVGHWF